MNNKCGFTLIEMLIALVVTMVIMGGAYSVFNSQQRQTTIQTNVSDAQQNVRAAMDFLSRDLRMAGYDPNNSGNFGISDIKFRDIDDGDDAAGNSFIRFAWDKIDDGTGTLDPAETIDYGLVNGVTITPGITDIYFRLPNDTNQRDVLSANIIALGLAYAYDDNDDGELDSAGGNIIWAVDADNDDDWDSLNLATGATAETGTPIDERTIRAVRIWLLGQSQAPDPKYTDTSTYIVGSHIITPNDHFRHRLLERTVLCRNMGL